MLGKRELLAQIYINRFYYSPTELGQPQVLQTAETILAESELLASSILGWKGARRLGAIYQLRGQILYACSDFEGVIQTWQRALDLYQANGLELEAANAQYVIGAYQWNLANQDLKAHFGEAETALQASLDFYERTAMRSQAADACFMLARLYINTALRISLDFRWQMFDEALNYLALGESNYDAIRRDFAAGSLLEAQQAKREITQKSWRLYELALEVLLCDRPHFPTAWQWVQKAKARALGDAMGTGSILPARIVEQLHQTPEAYAWVAQERELVARLDKVNPDQKVLLRQEIETLRRRMAQEEALTDYLELRTGQALDLEDVNRMFEEEAEPCTCVDWAVANGVVWLLTLRPGECPQAQALPLKVEAVQAFVEANLAPKSFRSTLRDWPEILQEMAPLVEPLAAMTQPNELLILCPTGPLHALPLHALTVDHQILLERNPVVYCSSLSILRHCLARQKPKSHRSLALFGNPSQDRVDAVEIVNHLAHRFGVIPWLGDRVTKSTFIESIQGRNIIHFQGHAMHRGDAPLDSCLVLADGTITAREIFSLSGLEAELVTLAACESAAHRIATGDEPLGLIPALLFAGSNAVVAGLWKVHQASAAAIMRYFYGGLEDSAQPISKAESLRQAMLRVRTEPEYSAPYHWAPFVLHGDWH